MKRYGAVIGLQPDRVAEYKRLHAAVWPDALEQITASNITNYSIFLKQPENLQLRQAWARPSHSRSNVIIV
jgi:L-rhamnose mutarotase